MTDGLIAPDPAAASGSMRSPAPKPEGASLGETAHRLFVAHVIARPWFDRATLLGLKHVFFPASRLWAAAQEAAGVAERFPAAVPMPLRHEHGARWAAVLADVEQARAASVAMDAEWQRIFFGPTDSSPEYRRAVEGARLRLRHAYNGKRWKLRALAPGAIPRARLAIETPAAVEAVHGGGLAAFDARNAPPALMPTVEQSRSVATRSGTDTWLRFASPAARLGDVVYARVNEPHDVDATTPTIIFGHGVCVDFDHWQGLIDESQTLVQRGFRIIRPEAPWHGRRAPAGQYGGERSIGAFPMGLLDSFSGALQEWAVLAHWARSKSKGALVFGGSSLGAMTSQLAADRSHTWPAALRPDALFLVTHTGDMAAAVLEGALAHLWASPEVVARFGWTPTLARQYLSLVNPVNAMPMRAENIVSILGSRDVILPFESGRQLVARWGVPPASAFIWDRGHFSVPATLVRDPAPLDRLADIARAYR